MALHWDASQVPNWEKVPDPVKEILIWGTLVLGMTGITEKNLREFWGRMHAWEHLVGPFRVKEDRTPVYLTPEEVRLGIGLKTNVAQETRSGFLKKVSRHIDIAIQDTFR